MQWDRGKDVPVPWHAWCANLTLEVEIGTVSIRVALPVVLQAAVERKLHHRAVQPITNVVIFTFTLAFALVRERIKKGQDKYLADIKVVFQATF